jgi:hypothetical protein
LERSWRGFVFWRGSGEDLVLGEVSRSRSRSRSRGLGEDLFSGEVLERIQFLERFWRGFGFWRGL